LQISSQKNFQHSQQASSRMKMNLFLPWDHKPNTLLALSIGTLTIHMPLDSCPDWYNSQMVTHSKGPKMCWLYVWNNDQVNLEDERNSSKQKQSLNSNLSWWLLLHQATGISNTRIHSTTQRETYQKEIWSCHHFCQPCKPSQLRMLPTANFLRQNSWSKTSLQSICKIPRSDNKTLSCQQWMPCRQCLYAIGSRIWSNNILLRSQFTLSKWNHQEAHPWPLRASLQATLTCKGKMARIKIDVFTPTLTKWWCGEPVKGEPRQCLLLCCMKIYSPSL
jgi:hypothetical protein